MLYKPLKMRIKMNFHTEPNLKKFSKFKIHLLLNLFYKLLKILQKKLIKYHTLIQIFLNFVMKVESFFMSLNHLLKNQKYYHINTILT
jgi:hypothetical protein